MIRTSRSAGWLLLSSLVAVAIAASASSFFFLHWLLVISAFGLLMCAQGERLAAATALSTLALSLAVGLGGAGVSLRTFGGSPAASGDVAAAATMLVVLAGAAAGGAYGVVRGGALPRTLGIATLLSLAAGVGGVMVGWGEGILGAAFVSAGLFGVGSLLVTSVRLIRRTSVAVNA